MVANFTPVPRDGYRIGVPRTGFWRELLNSDAEIYGGSGVGNRGGMQAEQCRLPRPRTLARGHRAAAGRRSIRSGIVTDKWVCIHGHFYQPPRENPWLEAVEPQPSAHPYRDWNERITAECYRPNAAARVVDNSNQIIQIVDNYQRMSFNVGPDADVVARASTRPTSTTR